MRQCTTCGRTYPNEVEECEYDGSPLFHIGDPVEEEAAEESPVVQKSAAPPEEANPLSPESGLPPALRQAPVADSSQPTPSSSNDIAEALRRSAMGGLPADLRASAQLNPSLSTEKSGVSLAAPTPTSPRAEEQIAPGITDAPTFGAHDPSSANLQSPPIGSSAGDIPATPGAPPLPSGRPPATPPSRPPSHPTGSNSSQRPSREPDTSSLLAGIDEQLSNLKEPEPIAPTYEPAPPMRSSSSFNANPINPNLGPAPRNGPPTSRGPRESFGAANQPVGFGTPPAARSSRNVTPNEFPSFSEQNFPPVKSSGGSKTLRNLIILLVVLAVLIVIGLVIYFVIK